MLLKEGLDAFIIYLSKLTSLEPAPVLLPNAVELYVLLSREDGLYRHNAYICRSPTGMARGQDLQ